MVKKGEWAVLIGLCLLAAVMVGCTVRYAKDGLYAIRKRPTRDQWQDTIIVGDSIR